MQYIYIGIFYFTRVERRTACDSFLCRLVIVFKRETKTCLPLLMASFDAKFKYINTSRCLNKPIKLLKRRRYFLVHHFLKRRILKEKIFSLLLIIFFFISYKKRAAVYGVFRCYGIMHNIA